MNVTLASTTNQHIPQYYLFECARVFKVALRTAEREFGIVENHFICLLSTQKNYPASPKRIMPGQLFNFEFEIEYLTEDSKAF